MSKCAWESCGAVQAPLGEYCELHTDEQRKLLELRLKEYEAALRRIATVYCDNAANALRCDCLTCIARKALQHPDERD